MDVDLKSMSRSELKKLSNAIDRRLKALDRADKAKARKAAELAARKYGFTLGDLVGETPSKSKVAKPARKRKTVAPKYRNPENPSETWSGRGRQPLWFKSLISQGKTPSELEIN